MTSSDTLSPDDQIKWLNDQARALAKAVPAPEIRPLPWHQSGTGPSVRTGLDNGSAVIVSGRSTTVPAPLPASAPVPPPADYDTDDGGDDEDVVGFGDDLTPPLSPGFGFGSTSESPGPEHQPPPSYESVKLEAPSQATMMKPEVTVSKPEPMATTLAPTVTAAVKEFTAAPPSGHRKPLSQVFAEVAALTG